MSLDTKGLLSQLYSASKIQICVSQEGLITNLNCGICAREDALEIMEEVIFMIQLMLIIKNFTRTPFGKQNRVKISILALQVVEMVKSSILIWLVISIHCYTHRKKVLSILWSLMKVIICFGLQAPIIAQLNTQTAIKEELKRQFNKNKQEQQYMDHRKQSAKS